MKPGGDFCQRNSRGSLWVRYPLEVGFSVTSAACPRITNLFSLPGYNHLYSLTLQCSSRESTVGWSGMSPEKAKYGRNYRRTGTQFVSKASITPFWLRSAELHHWSRVRLWVPEESGVFVGEMERWVKSWRFQMQNEMVLLFERG